MELSYQVATPDVPISPGVTAFQGEFLASLNQLSGIGYTGVELMTGDPDGLDWQAIKQAVVSRGMTVSLVCTGEVFGSMGLCFTDPDIGRRRLAVERVCRLVDLAAYLGANINIGRVRGQFTKDVPRDTAYGWAVEGLQEVCRHAMSARVAVALETVTYMQTNFINTVAEAVELIQDVKMPNMKLMMDVFHLNLEETDILKTIKQYADYVVHVHLADNNRRFPGQCGLNFQKIIAAFHQAGYTGSFSVEIYQLPDQLTAAEGAFKNLAPILKHIYS